MGDKMKKLGLLVFVALTLLLTGCGTKAGYSEVSYSELNKKMENKDSFPLFIGATSCTHCNTYKEILKEFSKKYDVEIFYIDIDGITKDEFNQLVIDFNFQKSTPTTMIITNGEKPSTFDMFEGASYDKLISLLKKHGYIGE